jgi:hypothetical protein
VARFLRLVSVVVAVHLVVLGFFFFKPPVKYFSTICVSTVIVWSASFAICRRNKLAGITAGSLLQLLTQQIAYHLWLSGHVGPWWPLVQFFSLQYVVALRLISSEDDSQPPPRDD